MTEDTGVTVGPSGQLITDAGRRLADAHNTARRADGAGRWIAARLSDGGTDGQVYDTRDDAIAHQLHELQCAYLMVHPVADMTPQEATGWIDLHRRAYDGGFRLTDPDLQIGMRLAPNAMATNRADRRRARGWITHPRHTNPRRGR